MNKLTEKIISLGRIVRFRGICGAAMAVFALIGYVVRKKFFHSSRWVKRIYNFKMELSLNDPGISKYLVLFGERELDHKYMIEKVLKEGMTILDIGANIGYYVLIEASRIGRSGRIYALEPSSENFINLRRNIELNSLSDIVEPVNIALSNKDSTESFYLSPLSNLNTFHPAGDDRTGLKSVSVKTVAVGTFLQGRRMPDLLRMDVEGHEVEILKSLIPVIKERKMFPAIIFEPHFTRYSQDHSIREPFEGLLAAGYRVTMLSSTDESEARFKDYGYHPERIIKSDFMNRGIYENVQNDDAVKFICDIGFVRTILLEKKEN